MDYEISPNLKTKLKKLKKYQPKIFKNTKKQLFLFYENPKHPSLRTHKLSGKLEQLWSISVGQNIRLTYEVINGKAIFFNIGTHDEVYCS